MRRSPPVLPNRTGQCLTAFAGLLTRRRGFVSNGISGGRPVCDLTDENQNSATRDEPVYPTICNTFNITFTTFRQNQLFETGSSLDSYLREGSEINIV